MEKQSQHLRITPVPKSRLQLTLFFWVGQSCTKSSTWPYICKYTDFFDGLNAMWGLAQLSKYYIDHGTAEEINRITFLVLKTLPPEHATSLDFTSLLVNIAIASQGILLVFVRHQDILGCKYWEAGYLTDPTGERVKRFVKSGLISLQVSKRMHLRCITSAGKRRMTDAHGLTGFP